MMQIDRPITSFLPLVWETWLFKTLSAKQRGQIASKLRLCAWQPGQLIYLPQELPSAVHCIVQGQVRLLGPIEHQSPTLAVVEKGGVIGWDSLLRRVAVGSANAAMIPGSGAAETLTIALPADDFEALAQQFLLSVLMQRVSRMELFDTLSRFLAAIPDSDPTINLKEVVTYIEQEALATVQHWQPSNATGIDLDPDRQWLVSSGESLNLAVGSPVAAIEHLQLTRPSRFPVRLLGIDRSFMSEFIATGTIPHTPIPQRLARRTFPPAPPQPADPKTLPAPSSFPSWKAIAPSPAEDLIACFGMICERLQVPYRPDSLRRSLTPEAMQQFSTFELYLRIAQAVGLNAQIVRFTPTVGGLNRLSTPALVPCSNIFAVLHDVTPKTAILGSPRTGLLRLATPELVASLTVEPPTIGEPEMCRAIVLERFPTTPSKRFGFHWFLPMVLKQRSILLQVLIASIFIQLLGLANPLLVQQVIDNVIINANANAMSMFGTLMVLFALLEGVLTILRTYLLISTTNRMDLHLGVEIVRHLLHLPLSFFEQRPVGELSARLSELENIRQFMTDTAITTVMDVVFSIFYIGVMFLYSPRLTFCVLATIPVVVISMLLMSTIQQKLIRLKAERGAKVQAYLIEVLSGISSVKSQHMESLAEATWRDRYVKYLATGFKTSTINTIFYSYSQFLNTVSSLLVLWVGAEVVVSGELTLGGLIAFRILTGYVTGPLLRLAHLWQRFQETSLSMDLLADIADAPVEAELTASTTALQLPPIAGQVQFHTVSFGFKPGQLQLTQVDLAVDPGTFVGIVGQSGSGKSTLMKLLPRLYLPKTGSITIDGYDVNKVELSSLRSQVGIVSQDAVLFQGTIRDNIALFDDLPDEVIIAAAKVAEAHDFIMQLPDGYATELGERGASLSGGQRQRIAIARVVLRNPRLLIFDEATSALDYETERRVCENLMKRFQGRTCFFITHRLNTIAQADWILFMQSGIIAEQGTHQELMARRQLYYCLYAQQSRQS
jgi:ATP-binding cassette, subfamily B, bacterial HlyB/CyaB